MNPKECSMDGKIVDIVRDRYDFNELAASVRVYAVK
jgi:hypothetical protein